MGVQTYNLLSDKGSWVFKLVEAAKNLNHYSAVKDHKIFHLFHSFVSICWDVRRVVFIMQIIISSINISYQHISRHALIWISSPPSLSLSVPPTKTPQPDWIYSGNKSDPAWLLLKGGNLLDSSFGFLGGAFCPNSP